MPKQIAGTDQVQRRAGCVGSLVTRLRLVGTAQVARPELFRCPAPLVRRLLHRRRGHFLLEFRLLTV